MQIIHVCSMSLTSRRAIRYGIIGCLAALAASVVYAIARLYVFGLRADLSILLVNVVLFAAIAVVLIYLSKKQQDIEEEFFRD